MHVGNLSFCWNSVHLAVNGVGKILWRNQIVFVGVNLYNKISMRVNVYGWKKKRQVIFKAKVSCGRYIMHGNSYTIKGFSFDLAIPSDFFFNHCALHCHRLCHKQSCGGGMNNSTCNRDNTLKKTVCDNGLFERVFLNHETKFYNKGICLHNAGNLISTLIKTNPIFLIMKKTTETHFILVKVFLNIIWYCHQHMKDSPKLIKETFLLAL